MTLSDQSCSHVWRTSGHVDWPEVCRRCWTYRNAWGQSLQKDSEAGALLLAERDGTRHAVVVTEAGGLRL